MHTFLIRFITFPGIIFHAMIRQVFCRWARLIVMDVCYFRIGLIPVSLRHEEPLDWGRALFITWGPFVLGSFIAFTTGISTYESMRYDGLPWLTALLDWLAISVATNAFPLPQDGELLLRMGARSGTFMQTASLPLAITTKLIFFSSFAFVDLIYALVVVIFLPMALMPHLQ